MVKENIFEIPSLYRDDFRIRGYRFGKGRKALCIVGSTRGNEYQQIFTCSQLVKKFNELEKEGRFVKDREVLVIPSLNPCSMNIEKRFWPTDNTDINRMFPGYSLGETTQRIAAGVFEKISSYENGIQFASFYMPGQFSSHVRIMKTGYENVEKARQFGLPYIVLKVPKPYDTTTLNYNWQIWETDAFSLYGTTTERVDEKSAQELIQAILRFMTINDILRGEAEEGCNSHVFEDKDLLSVRPRKSGIYKSLVPVQSKVSKGELLAYILDASEGEVIEELHAPCDGEIFFEHDKPLVYADTAVIKLLP